MEGNRTPNRNPNRNYQNLRPPPIQTNFTNTEVQPLRRTRRRLNFNNNNTGLSFAQRMAQAQSRASNIPSLNENNNSIQSFNNIPTQGEPLEGYEEPDFASSAIMRIKEPVEIHTSNEIKVYDYGEVEEVNVNPFELDNSMLIFKATNFYFQYPKEVFVNDLKNNQNIIFECDRALHGAPYKDDVEFTKPYYLLRASGNFAIPYGDMLQATEMNYDAYEIKKTNKHLAHTVSYDSVLRNHTGIGLRGQMVDIMSADHCQAGSDRDVYELIPIKFLPKVAGGRRKKQKGRGLGFSKTKKLHNSPKHNFLVHTLTGKKKNIESQKKSMKKAKKVLGVNK